MNVALPIFQRGMVIPSFRAAPRVEFLSVKGFVQTNLYQISTNRQRPMSPAGKG